MQPQPALYNAAHANPEGLRTVAVIGLGYIGLPTAAMLAARRMQVVGVDINARTVETINEGRVHIAEPELDMLVHATVREGLLRATTTPEPADAFIIAVPTPFKDAHVPDLRHVRGAAAAIAPVLKRGDLVILESTSPVDTTEHISQWLAAARPDLRFPHAETDHPDIHIAYCPERVLPGNVVRELVANDRVIGGITPACSQKACALYHIFVEGKLWVTDARMAAMTKLAENAFRDVNIAFANELSMLCGQLDVDVWELIRLANHHPRVNILRPGAGVGGHCIAVDPWFLVDSAPEHTPLIRTAREVNDGKPGWVLERIARALEHCAGPGMPAREVPVALLGLAFKPNIDDLRESPALRIAATLSRRHKGRLFLVEPNITTLPGSLAAHTLCGVEEALAQARVVVALVAHKQFAQLRDHLRAHHAVVDAVGITRREA